MVQKWYSTCKKAWIYKFWAGKLDLESEEKKMSHFVFSITSLIYAGPHAPFNMLFRTLWQFENGAAKLCTVNESKVMVHAISFIRDSL